LAARLVQLQVVQHRSLENRAETTMRRTAQELPPRAPILDRSGRPLAQSVPAWSVFVDKAMAKDLPGLARKLAAAAKAPEAEVLRKIRAKTKFPVVLENLDFERMQAVQAAKLEGVGVTAKAERFYPNGRMARGVLGTVGAEGKGLAGLELTYEARLRGKAGTVEMMRDGSGRAIYRRDEAEAQAAEPLHITLDRNIQYFAEEALEQAAASSKMRSGLIAVQDPRTGEILAMAAYPENPLRNPIVQDSYEPGSTFKIVAMAAALEEEILKPSDVVFCENGRYELAPGVVITDHEPLGSVDARGVMEHSSNIGMAKIVEKVGASKFYKAARAFGFASRTGLPLPGETSGELKPLSDVTKVTLAAASYGYGVSASALQVLSAYSAIANGGSLYEPFLLKEEDKTPVRVRKVFSSRTVAALQSMLEGVVERGTGLSARIPGYRVAGKTGTSRKLDPKTKKYSTSSYVASFAGYLPASQPQWTILVVVDEPKGGAYYGSQVAAPIFAKLGQRLLTLKGVPPDAPVAVAAKAK
jgi:cell division protein FtsI (penicillin-binding protein 3)